MKEALRMVKEQEKKMRDMAEESRVAQNKAETTLALQTQQLELKQREMDSLKQQLENAKD